jgi:hypothetical protein
MKKPIYPRVNISRGAEGSLGDHQETKVGVHPLLTNLGSSFDLPSFSLLICEAGALKLNLEAFRLKNKTQSA